MTELRQLRRAITAEIRCPPANAPGGNQASVRGLVGTSRACVGRHPEGPRGHVEARSRGGYGGASRVARSRFHRNCLEQMVGAVGFEPTTR